MSSVSNLTQALAAESADASTASEFDYKPMPVLAPITFLLGLFSALGLIVVVGLLLAVLGIILGTICVMRIRKSNGTMGGSLLANTGLTLSSVMLVAGVSWNVYFYTTELPEGFERVNFVKEISDYQFMVKDGQPQAHPNVQALEGKRIYLKGYMYPQRQTEELTTFLLLKDNQECCFGGQPELYDMIGVKMEEGQTVDYHKGLVAVGGILRVDFSDPGQLKPVYKLEGLHFKRARTAF